MGVVFSEMSVLGDVRAGDISRMKTLLVPGKSSLEALALETFDPCRRRAREAWDFGEVDPLRHQGRRRSAPGDSGVSKVSWFPKDVGSRDVRPWSGEWAVIWPLASLDFSVCLLTSTSQRFIYCSWSLKLRQPSFRWCRVCLPRAHPHQRVLFAYLPQLWT